MAPAMRTHIVRPAIRRRLPGSLLSVVLLGPLIFFAPVQPAAGGDSAVLVIIGADDVSGAWSRERVADIFLGRMAAGEHWQPIDSSDEALRERFYQSVAGISANRARARWARLVFSARLAPPREKSPEAAISAVTSDPNAITYIYSNQMPKKAHVVLTLPDGKP